MGCCPLISSHSSFSLIGFQLLVNPYIQLHFVGTMTSGRLGSSCSLPSSHAHLAMYLIEMLDMEIVLGEILGNGILCIHYMIQIT